MSLEEQTWYNLVSLQNTWRIIVSLTGLNRTYKRHHGVWSDEKSSWTVRIMAQQPAVYDEHMPHNIYLCMKKAHVLSAFRERARWLMASATVSPTLTSLFSPSGVVCVCLLTSGMIYLFIFYFSPPPKRLHYKLPWGRCVTGHFIILQSELLKPLQQHPSAFLFCGVKHLLLVKPWAQQLQLI